MRYLEKVKTSGIGGYFELELPQASHSLFSKFLKFQSARAAFFALLQAEKPNRVWVPNYICNAMIDPLQKLNIDHKFYSINNQFEINSNIELNDNDWLLYVNYFGICGKQVDLLLHRFSPSQIVLDYSQAFFSPPNSEALATIYSPRKFFGVPDGGLLYCQKAIQMPLEHDISSVYRTDHLLQRLAISPEAGYDAYRKAEAALSAEFEPKKMSHLSERILFSIDFDSAYEKRKKNFSTLQSLLPNNDPFLLNYNYHFSPLCYPYFSSNKDLRQKLISNNIYIPTYWDDAIIRLDEKSIKRYVTGLHAIPIDQRYGSPEMEFIASIINKYN